MYPQAMTYQPTGYRSRAASGLCFAQLAVISAADSGTVVLRRAEFLKEALWGGFENGYVFSTDKF